MAGHVVKRKGHKERFDQRKIYASCYAACLSSHIPHKEAKKICESVAGGLASWIRTRKVVTSDQVFREVARLLAKHSKDAAFMYETHRDIA